MAITAINPVTNSVLAHGDPFSFTVDDTYTSLVIYVNNETAYSTALGGAQAGFTITVVDNGSTHTFTVARDDGFTAEPTVVRVVENETGVEATTTFQYYLTNTAKYAEGMEPYTNPYEGTLIVTEGNVARGENVGWIDFTNGATVVNLGNGKVGISIAGGGGGGGGGGVFGTWELAGTSGGIPGPGEYTVNSTVLATVGTIEVHKTEGTSKDFTDPLDSILVGSIIALVDGVQFALYRVTAITDVTTYERYSVTYVTSHPDYAFTVGQTNTVSFTATTNDHGNLVGLGNDDHTQYLRTNGSRALTGAQSFGGNDATNVATVDADNVRLVEQPSAPKPDTLTQGQVFIKNSTPQELIFRDEDGNEYTLNAGLGTAEWKTSAGIWDLNTGVHPTPGFTEFTTLGTNQQDVATQTFYINQGAYPDQQPGNIYEDSSFFLDDLKIGDIIAFDQGVLGSNPVFEITAISLAAGIYTITGDYLSGGGTNTWSLWSGRKFDVRVHHKGAVNNLGAILPPTVNDDSGDGYNVGSRWYDTNQDQEYVCLDNTLGAAVWRGTSTGNNKGIGERAKGNSTIGVTSSGFFDTNNATPAAVTQIRMNILGDMLTVFDGVSTTGTLLLQDAAQPTTSWLVYEVTNIADVPAYGKDFTVVYRAAGGSHWSGGNYSVQFVPKGGGGSGVTYDYERHSAAVTLSQDNWRTWSITNGFNKELWSVTEGSSGSGSITVDPPLDRYANGLYFPTAATINSITHMFSNEGAHGAYDVTIDVWKAPVADGDTVSSAATRVSRTTASLDGTSNKMYVKTATLDTSAIGAGEQLVIFFATPDLNGNGEQLRYNFTLEYTT